MLQTKCWSCKLTELDRTSLMRQQASPSQFIPIHSSHFQSIFQSIPTMPLQAPRYLQGSRWAQWWPEQISQKMLRNKMYLWLRWLQQSQLHHPFILHILSKQVSFYQFPLCFVQNVLILFGFLYKMCSFSVDCLVLAPPGISWHKLQQPQRWATRRRCMMMSCLCVFRFWVSGKQTLKKQQGSKGSKTFQN